MVPPLFAFGFVSILVWQSVLFSLHTFLLWFVFCLFCFGLFHQVMLKLPSNWVSEFSMNFFSVNSWYVQFPSSLLTESTRSNSNQTQHKMDAQTNNVTIYCLLPRGLKTLFLKLFKEQTPLKKRRQNKKSACRAAHSSKNR